MVIAGAEAVEGGLGRGQIGELALGEDLGGDGAVEALDFALSLRMVDAAMPGFDAQPQPPRLQPGQPHLSRRCPGRPIVTEDDAGQAVSPKDGGQLRRAPSLALIATGAQRQRKAGVIIAAGSRDGRGRHPAPDGP